MHQSTRHHIEKTLSPATGLKHYHHTLHGISYLLCFTFVSKVWNSTNQFDFFTVLCSDQNGSEPEARENK